MLSSVVSLKRGVHAFMLLSLVCLLAAPGMADTVDTPVRQYGYSYGFAMSGITALSPDGSQFAVASGATVRIVDTNTGLLVRTLSGHLQNVTCLAWSGNGARIASGSMDYTARVWDAATGNHICTTSQPRGEVLSVALSDDGSRVITGTASLWVENVLVLPGAAYVWDGNTGVFQRILAQGSDVYCVALSSNGAWAATGSFLTFADDDNFYGAAYLWNLNTASQHLIAEGGVGYTQWGPVRAVAFGPGNRVITGGGGGDADSAYWEARVWTYTEASEPEFALERRLRPLLVTSGGRVASLSVSSTGILAAGLSSGSVRRWRISDGFVLPTLSAHSGEIKSVSHSSDAATTFVGSADGFVSQWETSTGRLLRSGHRNAVNAVKFSPDGGRILTGSSDERAFTWETGSSIEMLRLGSSTGHWGPVTAATYSADGGRILTGSSDATGKLWDSTTGLDLRTFMWHGQPVNAVAFSPDGLTVATGSSDLQAKLWDAGTGVLLQTFTGHSAEVTSVAFSPDGLTLATGSADTTARLWDVASGELLTTLSGHTGPVRSVVFSPDGTRVLTGARSFPTGAVDNTARLWDTGTGSVLHIFVGHSLGVTSVAFSPDGFQALTGSRDGSAIIWDTQSGVELRRYTGHVGEVTSVAFSPTERRIVTGSTDRVARLWEGLVVVPNVVGLVQATAESTLAAATLYAGPITEAYDNTIPAGSVASQDPAAGTGVSAGSPVALVVSLGPAPVTVPDVVGMTRVEAQTALSGVNLVEGDVTQQYSDTVPAGEVISQDPAAGTEVLPGTAVNLVVSLGAEPVMVPNVVGLLQAGATAAITGAGFEVGVVTQQYDPAPAGTVIAQSPLGGTMAPPGTPVSLVVSRGPQPLVNVPNIVGLTVGDAAAALLAADLTAGTFTEQHSATVPAGRVISQNPPAGAQALAGAPVDAAISLGPQPVPVPNVVGMTQEAAATAILGAGLVVGTVTREPSATVPAGSVIRQDPEGGAEALPGSPVNLVISEPEPVEVPNLVGRPQATANTLITSAGLVVGTVTEEYSATVPAGRVIRQNPEAGEEVDAGSPVDLVVSRGPEPVTMPNLVGKTRTAAQALLAAVQLREGSVTYEYSDTVARDIVLSQAKTPGSEVPAGTAVDFAVSRGVAPGVVPDIVGELRSDAEADIVAAGLVVGEVTERYDDNVRKDRVIRQTPAAGTELATGSPVNFVVSLGKEPAETSAVPNVVNTPSTSARAAIASAGFVVGAVTEKYDDVIPAGWVIAQSPAGGEERAAGTPVDLVVSLGKYLGPNADEARALLAALFEEADTDGDGKLSWEEALAAVPSLSRAVFDELDTNTDGYLDRAELGLPEEGCGACGCQKGDMTPGGLKQRLGDLFLSALALSVLAAFGRRGR